MKKLLLITGLLTTIACGQKESFDAQAVIDRSIAAHGSKVFEEKNVTFDFRNRTYSIRPTSQGYQYTRLQKLDSATVQDVMSQQGSFKRRVDGKPVQVPDSMALKYRESINSVAYFFKLPLPLNDPAVIKRPAGMDTINGQVYYKVAVTFEQEGGGADYQDEFRYWIDKDDHMIDYMAYNYQSSGGGTRFRQAINRRNISGLTVQDYINFKPKSKRVPLDSLPQLFEEGSLSELSRIEKSNILLTEFNSKLQSAN